MGRYDQNRHKKPGKSAFFISTAFIVLFSAGALYLYKDRLRTFILAETSALDTAPMPGVDDTVQAFADEQQALENDEIELLPLDQPQADISLAGAGQLFSQKTDLPNLLDSDEYVRDSFSKIAPGLARWLNVDQLLRRFVVILNDFSQGIRISKHMSFLRMDEPFSVEQIGDGSYISARSYHRYDGLAVAMQAIDAKAAVDFYQYFRPLMVQVFAEFSYPKDITLEDVVKKAMAEVIATPAIEGQVALIRPSVYYKYADVNLEGSSDVQKQMIRMGPENIRIIQAKCRELLVELAKADIR